MYLLKLKLTDIWKSYSKKTKGSRFCETWWSHEK